MTLTTLRVFFSSFLWVLGMVPIPHSKNHFIESKSQVNIRAELQQSLDHPSLSILNRKVHGSHPMSIYHQKGRRSPVRKQ
jgi:hypothetical protein